MRQGKGTRVVGIEEEDVVEMEGEEAIENRERREIRRMAGNGTAEVFFSFLLLRIGAEIYWIRTQVRQ